MTGTVAVQIADPAKFEAEIMVSEMDILQVKEGGEARVEVDAMSGLTLPAKVIHISPTATIQSGVVNYKVKVEVASLEEMIQGQQAARQKTIESIQQGELPERLKQAIEEGRITQEQAEERMQQMQGFRLVAPRHTWKLFWVMEFPTLAGAEAWIDAEIAPPYGRYGFQHYWLARRCTDDPLLHDWNAPLADEDANPHHIPPLEVDRSSFVAVGMARRQPAALDVDDAARGETGRVELLRSIGQQHGILSLQAFRLITPQPDWHVVWIVEFPTLDGVEAWIEAQSRPPHGSYWRVDYYLARRWAPGYVASWVPR